MQNIKFKHAIKSNLPKFVVEMFLYWKYRNKKLKNSEKYTESVSGKNGIEIGGPSILFKTQLPLYQKIQNLDGVNFSENTLWEGVIKAGKNFNYLKNKTGTQFISDGTDLKQINDVAYDFVLSSNCLEHIANPIKALFEWKRVLKNDGALVLVLPNKMSNFDRNRPDTTFDHLMDDFNKNLGEDDLTHLEEILSLHDLTIDPLTSDMKHFKARSLDNYKNRSLHHHVFSMDVVNAMLTYLNFKVIQSEATHENMFFLARKLSL